MDKSDHPKPIARYIPADGSHHDIDCDTRPFMVEAENGRYMLVADHEAALAAKDARIAKLERERNFHAEQSNTAAKGRMRSELDLEALRTAIEAKALEWKEKAPAYSSPYEKEIWLECAADLLALLEKKP